MRESGHPRLIYLGLLGLAGAIVLLTYLGVELPVRADDHRRPDADVLEEPLRLGHLHPDAAV